ncbi:MAG: hypothetical protein KC476_01205 [Cyanobacteria bacterium HKST-UBA06]|nr:hypothetical protein [Cyanobacteria bacterium HKST-UBA06]
MGKIADTAVAHTVVGTAVGKIAGTAVVHTAVASTAVASTAAAGTAAAGTVVVHTAVASTAVAGTVVAHTAAAAVGTVAVGTVAGTVAGTDYHTVIEPGCCSRAGNYTAAAGRGWAGTASKAAAGILWGRTGGHHSLIDGICRRLYDHNGHDEPRNGV